MIQNLKRLLGVKLPAELELALECIDSLDVADNFPVLLAHTRLLDYEIPVMALFKNTTAEWDLMDAYFQEAPESIFITQDSLNQAYTGLYIIRRIYTEELEGWLDRMTTPNCIISPGDGKHLTVATPLHGFFSTS